MPVTVIFKRGKHRHGPEAVIEKLSDLKEQHAAEQRGARNRVFAKGKHFEEKLDGLREARKTPEQIRGEAATILDHHDW